MSTLQHEHRYILNADGAIRPEHQEPERALTDQERDAQWYHEWQQVEADARLNERARSYSALAITVFLLIVLLTVIYSAAWVVARMGGV